MTAPASAPSDSTPPPLPQILVITGAMAAGKSSVAQALAERLPKAVHLRGDVFRRMIVSGRVDPAPGSQDQWLDQLRLRQDLAVQAAISYARAGFTVVYQDILMADLARVTDALAAWKPGVVVLCPRAQALAARDRARAKTGYVGWNAEGFDALLRAETPRLGLWLDTTDMTLEQTVDAILAAPHATRDGIA